MITISDNNKAGTPVNRIEDAKTERLLAEAACGQPWPFSASRFHRL
jgi:hypothetical protein